MAILTINFKCNNNCLSCLVYRSVANQNRERTFEEIKKIIDTSIKKGLKHLDLNGGEPTLHQDFFKILHYIKEVYPNLEVSLLSNGRMFSYKGYVKRLAQIGIKNLSLIINFYSGDAETHDSITRAKGSFKQTVQGIKNLLKYNFPVEVRTVINKINYRKLPETAEFVAENFPGFMRFSLVNLKVTGEAYRNRDKVLVSYEELLPYAEKATKFLLEKGKNVRLFHFPLCILKEEFWETAKGVTIDDATICYAPQCNRCKEKENCSRIWLSYLKIFGANDFKPIK